MRLWIINHYAVSPDLPGGTRHYELSIELVKQGFDVSIFASDVNLALRRHVKLASHELFKQERVNGIPFIWVRASEYDRNDWRRTANMLIFSVNLWRVARCLKERPDVILGSSPHPFAAFAAARLADAYSVPFVLELRDLWPQALIDMGRFSERHPGIRAMRWLEAYLYRRAAHIIVLTQGSVSYLRQRGVPEDRLALIPNGVHPDSFEQHIDREAVRTEMRFSRFTVLYAGAHGPANALDTVLDAAWRMRHEPEIEFVLIGDGPQKQALRARAETQQLNNVRFLDPIPKARMPEVLRAADVGLITLRDVSAFAYAVSPNKLFDYMAAGLPILAAIPGDMAHMVSEAKAGITVQPEDAEALAAGVRQMYSMSCQERRQMGDTGRRFVLSQYSRVELGRKLGEQLEIVHAREASSKCGGAAGRERSD